MKNLLKCAIISVIAFYSYNTAKHPESRASLQVHEIYDMLGNHLMDVTDALLQKQERSTDSAVQIFLKRNAISLANDALRQSSFSPENSNATESSQDLIKSASSVVLNTTALNYWPGEVETMTTPPTPTHFAPTDSSPRYRHKPPVNGDIRLTSHASPAQQAAWQEGTTRYDVGERDYAQLEAASLNRQAQRDLAQQIARTSP